MDAPTGRQRHVRRGPRVSARQVANTTNELVQSVDSGAVVHRHGYAARGGMVSASQRGHARSLSRTMEHCGLWVLLSGVERHHVALVGDGSGNSDSTEAKGEVAVTEVIRFESGKEEAIVLVNDWHLHLVLHSINMSIIAIAPVPVADSPS